MKSLTKVLLAATVLGVMSPSLNIASAQQVIATWWANQLTNLPPPNPFTNNTANPNVIVYPIMKGSGIAEPSGTAEYGGNGWTNAGIADSESSSITNNLFITYAIQAAPGYTISFSTNLMYFHNSATGPNQGELQYSTDGINYTDISALPYSPSHAAVTGFVTNTLAAVAALQNVPSTVTNYFRIVNWGATSSGGTWYIYDNPSPSTTINGTNGFGVFGSVTPVPPAQSVATWWVNSLTNLPPPNPFTNNSALPNVVVYPMTKGFGITEPSGTSEYGGNGWTNAGIADSESSSISNGLYLTYALQAAPGYTISFFTNLVYFHNSATGPNQGELQYSTDGSNYIDISSMPYSPTHVAVTGFLTNNLSTIQALQNVPSTVTNFFRIVNWGATSSGGTWYIYDNPPAGTPAGTNGFAIIGGLTSLYGVVAPTNLVVSPSNIVANAGQTVSFTVSQTGSPATNFWYEVSGSSTSLIASATSSTLTLSNVLGANTANYFVVLTNASGFATSSVVSLMVTNDPIIQIEPASVQGLINGTAQFSVTAFGTLPINYQWYFTDASGDIIAPLSNGARSDGSVFSGSAGAKLTVANLQATDLSNFVVVVSNIYGTATSSVASFLTGTNLTNPGSLPLTGGVLALWDFDGPQFTNSSVNPNSINNPAPFIGAGTASVIGTCYNPGTSPFSGATDPGDVGYDAGFGGYVETPFGFDQLSPNFSWGTEDYPAVTGTNKQNGVQFNVSTAGARNIKVSYDSRVSATASEYERLQYTVDGTNWIDYPASSSFSGLYGSGNAGFYNFSYDLTGFPGVDNNSNFAIRVVTEWQSTATYQTPAATNNTTVEGVNGVYATNFWVGTANSYSSGAAGNAAAGTVTYDLVAITGDAITNDYTSPVLSGFVNTNMVDTNTLVLNFNAGSALMAATNLSFDVEPLNTVSAGVFNQTLVPSFTVTNLGSTNFALSISFGAGYIPDPIDAAPILVEATDTNGNSAVASFLLTAYAINQPPTNTLTQVQATNTLANTSLSIPFIVGSARNPYSSLTYSVTSDNNTVVPAGNIVIGGNTDGGNPTVTITPAPNQVGNALISVTVSDHDPAEPRSTTATIAFTVRPNTNIVAIDYFNYDNSGSLDAVAAHYWNHLSGVNGQLKVQSGVAEVDTADNTENLQAALVGNPFKTNSGTVLYTSFTINMSSSQLPTANGSYITAFNDGSGQTANVEDCLVVATNGAAPGYYRVGINNFVGGTALTAQMINQDLSPGVPYFIVTSLVLSNGVSTIWLGPTNQTSPSLTDYTPPASPTNLYNIVNVELRESGNASGNVGLGNLIVGTSFNSVIYPPVANPDAFGVTENTTNTLSPLVNDVSGSSLSIVSVTPDSNGTAAINGTNVVFIPATDFTGTSVIAYTIADVLGGTSSSTITVTVTNNPPLANISYTNVMESSVNNLLNPLASDVLETPGGTLTLVGITPPANGSASIRGNEISYTPNAGYVGADTIGYTFTDGLGGTNNSTVLVTVGSVTPPGLNAQLSAGRLILSWSNAAYGLQYSTNVAGPYVTVPGSTSPYTNLISTNSAGFFRLVQ